MKKKISFASFVVGVSTILLLMSLVNNLNGGNAFADSVVATIPLEPSGGLAVPFSVATNANTNMIYVGQSGGNAIYIINGTNNHVTPLTVGTSDSNGIT